MAGFLAAIGAIANACTSSSATLTNPTTNKCQISLTSEPSSFGATGGPGNLAVSTARECAWSVSADAGWIQITGARNGQGDGATSYTVARNAVPQARATAIGVGTTQIQINQAAAPCQYGLSRTSESIGASGGALSFDVTTIAGCHWTAAPTVSWLVITAGQSGNDRGTVRLNVLENAGAARTGQVNVAEQSYTVSQSAKGPSPPPGNEPDPPTGNDPEPQSVDIEGKLSQFIGTCPTVSFVVDGRMVLTDVATEYRHGSCRDLSPGRRVRVKGPLQPDGRVSASLIEVR